MREERRGERARERGRERERKRERASGENGCVTVFEIKIRMKKNWCTITWCCVECFGNLP